MTRALRVLTFNCWLLRLGRLRVARDLAARAAAIPDAVAASGADVAVLQEVWAPELAQALAGRLRRAGYAHIAAGAARSGARVLGDGLLIASRHPLSAPARLTFTRRRAWFERLIAKGALAADVELPGGGPVRIVTAHLGVVRFDLRRGEFRSDDEATRCAQLDELGRWLSSLPARSRLLLAGDLNLADRPFACGRYRPEDSPAYGALLTGLGLRDAYREHEREGNGFTFDPATNRYAARGRCRGVPGQRIDYVLYRGAGLEAQGADIVFREPPLLSDHYGVRADFGLAPKISASSAGGVTSSWS